MVTKKFNHELEHKKTRLCMFYLLILVIILEGLDIFIYFLSPVFRLIVAWTIGIMALLSYNKANKKQEELKNV